MTDAARPPRLLGVAVFAAFFCAYMLSVSREPPWNDAKPIHQVAESLVARGAVSVETRWPYTAPAGRGGKWYSAAPLLPSLIHVPGAIANQLVVHRWPQAWAVAKAVTSHIGPAAAGALTCWLFLRMCLGLGLSLAGASVATGLLGLGTLVWVYARSPFSEITQTACFTGFFAALLAAGRAPGRRTAFLLGLWAGLLINTKLTYALALPGAAVFLLWPLRRDLAALRTVVGWAALGLVPGALMALGYNYARWGSLTNTGYAIGEQSVFRESLALGMWGMLLSPGKSLFLYCPPLVLSVIALPRTLRRAPAMLVAIVATAGPVLALHAKMIWWSGDWAWGPRYAVFAVPALLGPGAILVDDLLTSRGLRRAWLAAVAALAVCGAVVQVVGSAFYWDHYIRIAQEARTWWLGTPNRGGAFPWNRGAACDPCFEDLHPFIWLPPFEPIEGQTWLLRHVWHGDRWDRAEADAPWHRYTRLRLNIADSYQRARLDWWFLDFVPRFAATGRAMLAAMVLGMLAALAGWWRAARAGPVPA